MPAARFALTPAAGTRFDASAPALAFSADGTQLAWSGCDASGCRLYLRPLDRLEPAAIPGTDDGHAPFFSPDGRWIAFFADGRLKKVALAGGAPVTLADAPSILGGAWLDREIVFAGSPSGGLMRVSAEGGVPQPLTTPNERAGEIRHAWPSLVPNTRVLLFTIDTMAIDGAPGALGALSLDRSQSSEAASWRTLVAGVNVAHAAAPDTIVLGRGSELEAIAFDPVRMAVAGTPRTVESAVATGHGRAHYALSHVGSLAWATAPAQASSARETGLTWWSPAGYQAVTDDIRRLRDAALSPDGSRVAGVNVEGARADVWVTDVRRGTATRLTHSGINSSPVWSADGRTIYFASRTDSLFEIWARDAEGTQAARRISTGAPADRHSFPLAVSPDGALLAFLQTAPSSRADLWVLPLGARPGASPCQRTVRRHRRCLLPGVESRRVPVGRDRTMGDLLCSVSGMAVASSSRLTAASGPSGRETGSTSSPVGICCAPRSRMRRPSASTAFRESPICRARRSAVYPLTAGSWSRETRT